MGRFSVRGDERLVGVIWVGGVGMEGLFYLPVEDIVASRRVELKETGVRRMEVLGCLKAFVKQ